MIIPDVIPAWMCREQAVMGCPSWCLGPACHRDPGGWTGYHIAYRSNVCIAGRVVTVEVAAHQLWGSVDDQGDSAQLYVVGAHGLPSIHTRQLLDILRGAASALALTGSDTAVVT